MVTLDSEKYLCNFMLMKALSFLIIFISTIPIFSQNNDTTFIKKENKIKIDGYNEVYYCYDLNQPANHLRPSFLYNHNKHNEVNINLAFIRASYENDKVRGNIALMAGTYAQYNLSAEESVLQHVFEANAGFKLVKGLWLDAGVFASHIGFESAVSKDCWTLSRSLVAENSPYYESGAKLSWTPNEKWLFSLLYLNGWQRISRVAGNNSPSFGMQINYKTNSKIVLNYSNYIGNTYPDSVSRMRYYHNLYCNYQINKSLGIIAGFDLGMEQLKKDTTKYAQWYTPVMIIRYQFNDKFAMAARGEYFKDKDQVLINTKTTNGFDVIGYSLNLDYNPLSNVLFRIEGRLFQSKDKIFVVDKRISNQNMFFTTSLVISF